MCIRYSDDMAEFPTLGKRCSIESCQQLDFLPFECKLCQRIFCLDHRSVTSHCCPFENSICQTLEMDGTGKQTTAAALSEKCEHVECKTSLTSASVSCNDCGGKFCLQHRHPFDHDCSNIQKESGQQSGNGSTVQQSKAVQLVEEIKKEMKENTAHKVSKPVSSKNAATAAKIALMKLKQTAVGDHGKVPEEERIYMRITLPDGYKWKNLTEMPIFFSKAWSIGKCISTAATYAGLQNEINKDGRKLRLRFVLPSVRHYEMDENIGDLERDSEVMNGGTFSLIYS